MQVTQPVFGFGRLIASVDAAKWTAGAAAADEQHTKLDTKMSVAEAYVTVLLWRQKVNLARQDVNLLTAHLHDVQNKLIGGTATQYDLVSAQLALDSARQGLLAATNQLNAANAGYNRSLSRPWETRWKSWKSRTTGCNST